MPVIYSSFRKVLSEQIEQQIGFSAPANAGNNFDKAIVLARYDALKISVSFDGHVCQPPLHATSIYTCLRILYHKSGCDYKWLYIQSAIYTAVAIAFRKHLLKF